MGSVAGHGAVGKRREYKLPMWFAMRPELMGAGSKVDVVCGCDTGCSWRERRRRKGEEEAAKKSGGNVYNVSSWATRGAGRGAVIAKEKEGARRTFVKTNAEGADEVLMEKA